MEIVSLGLPEIVTAFASKSIDAAWNAEPANTLAEKQGVAKVVAGTGDLLPGGVGSALALAPDFAKQQPEAAQRFVTATLRGMRDYYHAFVAKDVDKSPYVPILVNRTTVKDPALYDVLGFGRVDPNPVLDFSAWGMLQDYFVSTSMQSKKVDTNKYVDPSYVENALTQLGRE